MGTYNTRDGAMNVMGGGAQFPVNYEPNSSNGPKEAKEYAWAKHNVSGSIGRYPHQHPNTNYEQPRELFNRVFAESDRVDFINNISGPLSQCRQDIKDRFCAHLLKVDDRMGKEVSAKVGANIEQARL